jgi:hypothetical protein
MMLTSHILDDRKISPTQPGRGIRKVVDLYHDLTDLMHKANKYSATLTEPSPARIMELESIDFVGMTEVEIEDEQKE